MRPRKTTPFKRVNTRSLVAKKKTQSLVKLIKGVTLKQSETCYKSVYGGGALGNPMAPQFFHNTISSFTIYDSSYYGIFPSQGNSDGERRGDEIYTTGIRLRMAWTVPYDRRNSTFRMYVLPYNSTQGSPIDKTLLFHNISGNIMLDPIQTDRWKGIKYLGTYRCKSRDQATDGQLKTIMINKWIPLKRKVTFLNDGSVVPASGIKENLVILITAYDSIPTLATDVLADHVNACATLYYKDP